MRILLQNVPGQPIQYRVPIEVAGEWILQSVHLTKVSAGPGVDPLLQITDADGGIVFTTTLSTPIPLGAATYEVTFAALSVLESRATYFTIPIPPNLRLEVDDLITISDLTAIETMTAVIDLI